MLERKRASFVASSYVETRIFPSLSDYVASIAAPAERPHAFVVASPAAFRGSTRAGRDIELAIHKSFPTDTPAVRALACSRSLSHELIRRNVDSFESDLSRETPLDRLARGGTKSCPPTRRL